MEIKVYHNLKKIKKEYLAISQNVHPLQKFSVTKNIFSFAYFVEPLFYNIKKFRSYNFYVVYDNNLPILIMPTTRQQDILYIMGGKEWDYVDLIYSETDINTLKKAFNELIAFLKSRGIAQIHWFYLHEKSPFYQILKEQNKISISTQFAEERNVNVIFSKEHNEYFSALSKSVRQNCRTAYNRIARDNKNYELKIFFAADGKKLRNNKQAFKLFKKCMKVYLERQIKKYHTPKRYALRIKYYDYFTKSAIDENGFISALIIDNKIAAFMMGLSYKEKNLIIIPRIAIDDNFSFYSPGLCLINETIKFLGENSEFCNLDLCDGDEKYKYDMGGTEYLTYKMIIDIL